MKYRTNILIIGFLVIGNICLAQSIMPNNTSDVQQVQNFEFVGSGNITLTTKAVLVKYGADFTNGFMQFEKKLDYPLRSFFMEYNYSTETGRDTALIKLIFKDVNNVLLGEMSILVYELNTLLNISISNPNFIYADKVELLAYASHSPWIGKGSVLEIKSMLVSNQISQSNSNYQVFPNPVSNTTILRSLDGSTINKIQVLNSSGTAIKEYLSINNSSYQLDFSNFISGQYHVLIYSQSGISSKKVIVL